MDPEYQAWYNSVFGVQSPAAPQTAAPGPAPLTPAQWSAFYKSVGIPSGPGPTTRTVQSVPVLPKPPTFSASDMARGKSGITTIASIPTTPTQGPLVPGPTGYTNPNKIPDRLTAGIYPANPDGPGATVSPTAPRLPPTPLTQSLAMLMRRTPGTTVAQIPTAGAPAVPGAPPLPRPRPQGTPPVPAPRPAFRLPPVPFPRPDFGMGGAELPDQPNGAMTPQQFYRATGVPADQAYNLANNAAALRARLNAPKPSYQSTNGWFNHVVSGGSGGGGGAGSGTDSLSPTSGGTTQQGPDLPASKKKSTGR